MSHTICDKPSYSLTIGQGSVYNMDLQQGPFSCGGTAAICTTAIFVAVDTLPKHGTYTFIRSTSEGTFISYTPNPSFHGTDSFKLDITTLDSVSTAIETYTFTFTVLPKPTPAPTPSPTLSPTPSPTPQPTAPRSFICATSNRDTWQNHRNAVKAKNGNLLTIPDQATQTYIENNFAPNHYFIGLKDVSTGSNPRNFQWDDNDPSTYRNWAPNEPNNWGGSEDCGEVSPPGGWKWNDQGCWRQRWALVQFPWSEYDKIVCDTSNVYSVCRAGPGNTFDYESCPQTAPEFIESASGSDKLSQQSIIGGSFAIGFIAIMSLMAVVYLGNKNQWSWFRTRTMDAKKTGGMNDGDDKDISVGKDDTALAQEQEELADIENC